MSVFSEGISLFPSKMEVKLAEWRAKYLCQGKEQACRRRGVRACPTL